MSAARDEVVLYLFGVIDQRESEVRALQQELAEAKRQLAEALNAATNSPKLSETRLAN
jgi:hypothetical protein